MWKVYSGRWEGIQRLPLVEVEGKGEVGKRNEAFYPGDMANAQVEDMQDKATVSP